MGDLNLADAQGNILRGYRMATVRHLLVRVADAAAARRFLGAVVPGASSEAPQVTTAEQWDEKPTTCLNVGITAAGLRALGVSDSMCRSFPEEFLEGPVTRAAKIGDVEDSAPEHWQAGLDRPDGVHVMWTIHAGSPGDPQAAALLEEFAARLLSLWSASGAFTVVGRLDGTAFEDDRVHFGYRDSISQPRFRVSRQLPGTPGAPPVFAAEPEIIGRDDCQPIAQLGSVLLGHKTPFPDVKWQMPAPRELGYNGCFNAFRVLEQDVDGFEEFLARSVAEHGTDRPFVTEEWIAA
jgi:deferrochelatase/peroxidase EfeB